MAEPSGLSSADRVGLVPVRAARRLFRATSVAVWTGLWSLIWGAGTLLLLPLATPRQTWRLRCFRNWAQGTLAILRVAVRLSGPTPRQGPFVLVTNHLSYLDVVLIARLVPSVFVAKSEVRSWPVWGVLSRAMGTVFVDRSKPSDTRRVASTMARILASGVNVVVFPEGTSTDGMAVARFRSSLLQAAAESRLPVYAGAIRYRTGGQDPPARMSVCWWGDMTFLPHFWELCGVSRIEALVAFDPEPATADDRKLLTRTMHSRVVALHAGLPDGNDS